MSDVGTLIGQGRAQQDRREEQVAAVIGEVCNKIKTALGPIGEELLQPSEITDTVWRLFNSGIPEVERMVIRVNHDSLASAVHLIYQSAPKQGKVNILLASSPDATGPDLSDLSAVSITNGVGDGKTLARVCDFLALNANDDDTGEE
jgi:hypothetical protein